MVTVKKVEFVCVPNAGCNNGVPQPYRLTLDVDGRTETCSGETCRCGSGCHGLDRLPEVGTVFDSISEFLDFLDDQDYIVERY